MHIGKRHNIYICQSCSVSAWTETEYTAQNGKHELKDQYIGEEVMNIVQEKKYLGDIISHDMKNTKYIKAKTNRAIGIVNRISTCLYERPYGKHTFKAAILMSESPFWGRCSVIQKAGSTSVKVI